MGADVHVGAAVGGWDSGRERAGGDSHSAASELLGSASAPCALLNVGPGSPHELPWLACPRSIGRREKTWVRLRMCSGGPLAGTGHPRAGAQRSDLR